MMARPVELSSHMGRIFWYSGELYQRFTAAVSANSRMTIRFGSGSAFDQFGGAGAGQEAAAIYCVIVAPTATR